MKPIFIILFLSSFVALFFQNCSPASFSTDIHYLDESLNKDGEDDNIPQDTPPADEQPPTVEQPPETDDPDDEQPPEKEEPCDDDKPGTPGDDDDHDGDHDPDDDAKKFNCGNDGKEHKVLICHVPSGNSANRHNICIAKSALKAHINKHGDDKFLDYYGECKDENSEEEQEED